MPNYKSVVGADQVYYAPVTQDDASAYAAGTPTYLAPVMTITIEPTTNVKTQYADNIPFDVMMSEGETKLTVEITGLPLNLKAILLGKVYDATIGRMFDNGGISPFVALAFRAKKSDGGYRYYWFLKGRFNQPQEEFASLTDTPDPKSIKLEFTAIKTTRQFAVASGLSDSVKRVMGDTADPVFSATNWFTSVQVPSVGAPSALTCTPTPTDGATGIALTVAPKLVFNNALRSGSENGIILVRADTAAPIACERVIDPTRKEVTLTPGTVATPVPLELNKKYHVIVPGVVDIYGQALADTVYDFTTVTS